jgi:hypothetical protein
MCNQPFNISIRYAFYTSNMRHFHYSMSVCPCYPDECGKLPIDLLQLLDPQGVLRGACLAASGRLGGGSDEGGADRKSVV